MDAYEILQQVRHDVAETTEAHWTDLALLRKLRMECARIWRELSLQPGGYAMTSGSVTVTDSVITLPSDCAKPLYLETDQDVEVVIRGLRESRYDYVGAVTTFDGTYYTAYQEGETLKINADSVNGTWTLWYLKRMDEVLYGVAGGSSGASALHLEAAMQPSQTDDTYNGLSVFTYDATTGARKLSTVITDYAGATLVATITGTPASGDYYGSELGLPLECEDVLLGRIVLSCLAKVSSAIDPKYFEYQRELVRDAEKTWKAWLETSIPGSRSVRVQGRNHG